MNFPCGENHRAHGDSLASNGTAVQQEYKQCIEGSQKLETQRALSLFPPLFLFPRETTTTSMGTTASKPAGAEAHVLPAQVASSQEKKESDPATCPLGFGQKQTGGDASPQATTAGSDASPAARCPVKGTKGNAAAVDDASSRGDTHAATAAATTAASPAGGGTGGGEAASGCPVKKEDRSRTAKYLHPHKYNVYSQRVDDGAEGKQSKPKPPGNDSSMAGLDPSNNMPVNPNQLPAAGQQVPLSTERVRSTIPKGGEETTWTYPSPQMFW